MEENKVSNSAQQKYPAIQNKDKIEFLRVLKESLRKSVYYLFLFSSVINFLLLVLPLYSLQVFDRVLSSGSIPTLTALSLITIFCFILFSIFNSVREYILIKISGWLDNKLNNKVLKLSINHSSVTGQRLNSQFLMEASNVKNFITSPQIFALFDLPWSFIFIFIIFLVSPQIGILVTVGAIILFCLTYYKEKKTKPTVKETNKLNSENMRMIDEFIRHSEVIEAMGMFETIKKIWQSEHELVMERSKENSFLASKLNSISKMLRMTLQIGIIGYGTYLALGKDMTFGGIIACSIIAGKALAPLDSIMALWSSFANFRDSYDNLENFLNNSFERPSSMNLGRPKGNIVAEKVVFLKPGSQAAIIKNVDLNINAGDVVGIIGPSGGGKSTLMKLLAGIYKPTSGIVRIDGADVFMMNREDIGKYIGYLPQTIDLLRGSIKQNIARFDINAKNEDVISAAKKTGVHELILSFPNGYDTIINDGKIELSGGQKQRVALARAFYGDPQLIFLDEPNANLDEVGERMLLQAITIAKNEGRTLIMISHKPSIVNITTKIIVIKDGALTDFGNKDEIMGKYASK